ncbi:MAG TPA: hypothetical protein VLL69_00555 [Streptosporangiaceae bacterium]|nr:hypothetical protein [Streptosporangiaceae bacterium]
MSSTQYAESIAPPGEEAAAIGSRPHLWRGKITAGSWDKVEAE